MMVRYNLEIDKIYQWFPPTPVYCIQFLLIFHFSCPLGTPWEDGEKVLGFIKVKMTNCKKKL